MASAPARGEMVTRTPRMLVIDGEASVLFAVRDYFVPQGYDVSVAGDLDEAEARLSEQVYDVAVIDLKAGPGGDTLGLDRVAQVHERYPATTVIVLVTPDGTEDSARDARRHGAVFLEKPVPLPVLSTVIEELRSSTHTEGRPT